jgi:hypothetical protein
MQRRFAQNCSLVRRAEKVQNVGYDQILIDCPGSAIVSRSPEFSDRFNIAAGAAEQNV